jgi:hypothetical protein
VIDEVDALLDHFADTFAEESPVVELYVPRGAGEGVREEAGGST